MYDIIGDIHGHYEPLCRLLGRLGYQRNGGGFKHPNRTAVFVGDLVDRGPHVRQTVETVREMVEQDAALIVMGNHEFNTLSFHTSRGSDRSPADPEFWLRPRTPKNILQQQATWDAWQLDKDEHRDDFENTLSWFRTLPFALELDGIRVVHATWDDEHIALLNEKRRELSDHVLTADADATPSRTGDEERLDLDSAEALDCSQIPLSDRFLQAAHQVDTPLFNAIDDVLKGRELPLPPGRSIRDKEGTLRRKMRVQWFRKPGAETLAHYAMPPQTRHARELNFPLPLSGDERIQPYPAEAVPVFFGHYWMQGKTPEILADNVCCVDYSVAKNGMLCAYRWNGERLLSNKNFVCEPA